MNYRFDKIAFNSTAKKTPTESDKEHYIGLEHIDSECLEITRWGSDVAPIGEKLIMKKGDVLFGKRRAYQRKLAIAPFDGIFSAHGMVLRPNEEVVDKNYFPFFMSSDLFMERAVQISVGGLSPTINWKDLREQEFPLPSLAEQKVLADKLWAAYRLKKSYKKLLAAAEGMVKSQFIEMFGDFHNKVHIKDVCHVVSGKSIPTKLEDIDGNNPYIKVADFNIPGNEKYITIAQRYVSDDSASYSKQIPEGSVIFAKNGAASMSNKKRLTKIRCCIDMNTMAVFPKNESILSDFLFATIEAMDVSSHVRQGTIPSISPKSIEDSYIPMPTMEEQYRYVSIAKHADKSGSVLLYRIAC